MMFRIFAVMTAIGFVTAPVLGCQRAAPSEVEAAKAPAAPVVEAPRVPSQASGPELAGPLSSAAPVAGLKGADGPPNVAADDDEDDDENKDYWAKIAFNRHNFDEVREYVKTYYIDADVDEARAYAEAANFALHELDPPRELLPEAFYKARKGLADEEGALDGPVAHVTPGDPYVVHTIPEKKEEKEPKKRLSDDEIRVLRKKAEARSKALAEAWDAAKFDEKRFSVVMSWVEKTLEAQNRKTATKRRTHKKKGHGKGGHGKKDQKDKPRTTKHLWVAAAQGFLYSLDPHSSLVSAEAWDESTKRTTDSSFEGIGAILTQRDDRTLVESPIEGRPAQAAGIRAGDVITHVDGKDISAMPLHKVVKRIRGKGGTVVTLTVRREGDPSPHDFQITRAHIDIKNVSGHLLEPHHPGIAYLKVTGFVPTTSEELRRLYEELRDEHAKKHGGAGLRGIVFDLRNNSGGLLQQGVKVADMFVEDGVIVEVRNRIRKNDVYRAHKAGTVDLPVVVLVNDGSASASEIVASAIQDNHEGLLVGDRTFGKASVQTLFNPILRKDYYIKLTIARYFAPSGRTIQVVGVHPEFEVPPDAGGKMPLGFREENLSHHLKPLDGDLKSPNAAVAEKVAECAGVRGIADQIHESDPNPQIKYDYQLMKAADDLECYIDVVRDKKKAAAK